MIVTFYSFKGGVGRSMALANVGELLADLGYRVVVCDWDLEAPGLERYFVKDFVKADLYQEEMTALAARPGIMDLLAGYKETLKRPLGDPPAEPATEATHAWVGKLLLRRPFSHAEPVQRERSGPGWLRLLTAGRRDGDFFQRYAETVRRFDWEEFYERWAGDAYVDFFRQDLVGDARKGVTGEADVVLIDSRTGVTEQGGVCTHHLADLVVLVTAANDLNMDGSRWMARALADERLTKIRGGRPLQVLPVAARIEQTAQKEELADFRNRFVKDFREPIAKAVGDPERFALASEIPYIPFYSFHERIVAREPEEQRDKRLYAAYQALADGVVRYGLRASLLREPSSQARVVSTPLARSAPAPASWDGEKLLERLQAAVESFDPAAVEQICGDLISHLGSTDEVYPETQAATFLRTLRRKRYFDLMQRTAEAFLEAGQTAPQVRRLYAQALIEKGDLTAALGQLQLLVSESGEDPHESAEARGLIGRIYQQKYVSSPDPASQRGSRNLERAVNAYHAVYSAHPDHLWFGISTVALVMRGRRDGLTIEGFPDPESLAAEILTALQSRDSAGRLAFWDLATATEACLALGRGTEALEWIVRYVNSPDVDAFDLESLLRHLTEVWQLDPGSEPGASLLPILKSQLLRRAGGQGSLSAQEIVSSPARNLEKVLGNSEGTLTLQWYRTGLERSRAVARIETRDGQAVGSGFLLRGKDVHPSFGNKLLLVTCAHVLSDDPNVKSALRSQEARVTFEASGADSPYEVAEILWTSSPDRLDTTVALLAPPVAGATFCPIAARLPAQDSSSRVYIIGHPGGRTLSISLSDNLLLDWEPPWIHYRAPAEPGSAGSPVFNSDWKLIGIHHAGGQNLRRLNGKEGTYAANEGIWIQSILRQVAQDLPGPRAPKRRREPSNS
jgi:hypothetical protein